MERRAGEPRKSKVVSVESALKSKVKPFSLIVVADEPTLTCAAAELAHGGGGRGDDGPGSKHPAPATSSQDGAGHRGGGES